VNKTKGKKREKRKGKKKKKKREKEKEEKEEKEEKKRRKRKKEKKTISPNNNYMFGKNVPPFLLLLVLLQPVLHPGVFPLLE